MEVWLLYILTLGNPTSVAITHYSSEVTCKFAMQAAMQVKPPLMPKYALCVKGGQA